MDGKRLIGLPHSGAVQGGMNTIKSSVNYSGNYIVRYL